MLLHLKGKQPPPTYPTLNGLANENLPPEGLIGDAGAVLRLVSSRKAKDVTSKTAVRTAGPYFNIPRHPLPCSLSIYSCDYLMMRLE
jgi:hypothetical protein